MDPTQTKGIPELGVLGPVCRFLGPRSQGNVIKFRFRKSRVLLTLLEMVFICSFQRRSSDRETPSRYLTECSESKTCPLSL